MYNTDINKEEFWTGNNWINDDCVQMTNTFSTPMITGQIVGIDPDLTTSITASAEVSINTREEYIAGVIFRGGNVGSRVIIACTGLYKTYFQPSVTTTTRQFIAQIGTVSGSASVSTTGKTIGSAGAIGVIAESFAVMPANRLVNVWIAPENY